MQTSSRAKDAARNRLPPAREIPHELRQAHGVQHPIRWHAAFAGHLDAPMHMIELSDRVGIRIDAEHATEVECSLMPAPVEIQPPGVGVDLYGYAVPCAGAQYRLDIDVVAGAAH